MVCNCIKTEDAGLNVILSTKEQRVFVQDMADHCKEVESKTEDVDEDWDFEGTVSVDEMETLSVHDNPTEDQRICEDGGEAESTFVAEVIVLTRKAVETKRDNAKLADRPNDLVREPKDVRSVERLVSVILEVATARVQTVEVLVKDTDAKHETVVDKTAQTEMDLRSCPFSKGLSLKAERGRVVKFAGDNDAPVDQPGEFKAKWPHPQERDEAL